MKEKNQNDAYLKYRNVQEKLNQIKPGDPIPDEMLVDIINALGESNNYDELKNLFTNEFKLDLFRKK